MAISFVICIIRAGGGAEGGSHLFHHSGDADIYEGKWPSSARQRPRCGKCAAAVVRGLWPLITDYSIAAVQQRQQSSSPSHYTRRAVVGGFIKIAKI